MPEGLQDFFQQLGERLFQGDLKWLSDVYLYPLSIFVGDDIRVEQSPEDTMAYIHQRREDVYRYGARSIRSEITKIGGIRDNRFATNVDFVFLDAAGRDIARNSTRYFCQQDKYGRLKIESLELLQLAIPLGKDSKLLAQH